MKNYNGKKFLNDFLNPLIKEKETLVVYFQDKLSLEDFINLNGDDKRFMHLKSFFDKEPSLLLPSVTNPAESFSKLKKNYKIKQFYLNESYIDDIVAAAEKNNVILLHSSDSKELDQNNDFSKLDNLMNKVKNSLEKLKISVTYLLTGNNPSWDKSSDESRISRHLLAVENTASNYTLLNFSDCGLLYTKSVSWKLLYNSSSGEDYLANSTTTLEAENSDCKLTNKSVEFEIKMSTANTGLSSASLKLSFNTEFGGWFLEEAVFTFSSSEASDAINLTFSKIDAPKKFSYSCYKTIMSIQNRSDIFGNITFDVFQVQPFKIKSDNFAESFDCVTFFTLPIWMGFMVVLILTIILAIGIYMLFNIHTMDRFDDPKGKPLPVPTID